ncbi:hypothetical protein WBP07_18000 [Novosphingobium sp. BL-8A]|uniref:hypothetical protein n=1 Tax=Novosphingobium sp. BL-8A TaxID=3127639 RepID=UPI0037580104
MTEDTVAALVDAMTLDPFMDDVILMGTTQQDMRMEHYARVAVAALQSRPAEPARDDEGPCTDCDDTGITIQTERRCSCDAAEPAGEEPVAWMDEDADGRLVFYPHCAFTEFPPKAVPLYARPATPSNPERLVEAAARAIAGIVAEKGTFGDRKEQRVAEWVRLHWADYRDHATAAISAAPAQNGREG